jgi:hypothetical protein
VKTRKTRKTVNNHHDSHNSTQYPFNASAYIRINHDKENTYTDSDARGRAKKTEKIDKKMTEIVQNRSKNDRNRPKSYRKSNCLGGSLLTLRYLSKRNKNEAKTGTDASERSAAGGSARRVCPGFRGINVNLPAF